jgi:hypothetical protein
MNDSSQAIDLTKMDWYLDSDPSRISIQGHTH